MYDAEEHSVALDSHIENQKALALEYIRVLNT